MNNTNTANTFDSLRIPTGDAPVTPPKTKETKEDLLYAKRIPKGRYITKITVDPATNRDLIAVQALPELQIRGKSLSRATLIRRAIRLYTRQVVRAKMNNNTMILENEAAELGHLVSNRKNKPVSVFDKQEAAQDH